MKCSLIVALQYKLVRKQKEKHYLKGYLKRRVSQSKYFNKFYDFEKSGHIIIRAKY